MAWFEIELNVPAELREPIVNRLFELGAQGVSEDDSSSEKVRVQAYFDGDARDTVTPEFDQFLDSMAEIHPTIGRLEPQIQTIEDQSWADEYKRFYQAQKLSRRFYLRPAWDESAEIPAGFIPIVMDPKQAFGTGLHPSTQLCLNLLERALAHYPRRENVRLLDVGTGSGILAIAAAKLGVQTIDAIDNDPVAVEAAQENVGLNDTAWIDLSERDLSTFSVPYDVVLSNILLETHHELIGQYVRLVKHGGQLILSGLLAHQRAEVMALVTPYGFVLEDSEARGEWFSILFTRVSAEATA